MKAADDINIEMVRVLVSNGADLCAVDAKGRTVLHYAVFAQKWNSFLAAEHHVELVDFLILKGCIPSQELVRIVLLGSNEKLKQYFSGYLNNHEMSDRRLFQE